MRTKLYCLLALLFAGCAAQQGTEQTQRQDQVPTNTTTITVRNDPWNGPNPGGRGEPGVGDGTPSTQPSDDNAENRLANANVEEGTGSFKGRPATYWQQNIFWYYFSASGSSGANGTNTGTANPQQHQRPETSVSANAGLAPGGIVDQGATAANRGSATSEKTSTQTLTTSVIKGTVDWLKTLPVDRVMENLFKLPPEVQEAFLAEVGPTSVPAEVPNE